MRAAAWRGAIAGSAALWFGCSNPKPASQPKILPASILAAGDSCAQSSDCSSGLCLGLHCCSTQSCGTDSTCQGTSCDPTGACVYPAVACGSPSCDAKTNQLTTNTCSQGVCVAGAPSTCPGNLTCANTTACRASCTQSTDCTSAFYCSNGSCLAQVAAGAACASNDACTTSICGVAGSGHCCNAACVTGDPHGCGASDCDATGACSYPVAGTSCVDLACSGHAVTEPASCDGLGVCAMPTPATADCAPYACGSATACATSCNSSAGCSNAFCQIQVGVCCPFYASNTLLVDGTQGVDQACCGSGAQVSACATIGYAVKLAEDTGAFPVTLSVANPPNGMDWTADTFPIVLDQGVILSAPGLYFSAPSQSSASELFRVENVGGVAQPVPSVIGGTAMAPIRIGFDSLGNSSETLTDIEVGFDFRNDLQPAPVVLDLLNVQIQVSGGWPTTKPVGVFVGENATLTLGTDGLGTSGTVWIDAADGGFGESGILCGAGSSYLGFDGGSWVNDTGSAATPSVWIQHQDDGLEADPGCDVNLTGHPRFGSAPGDAGTCASDYFRKTEGAVIFSGGVINNATFQCNEDGALFVASRFSGDNDLFELNGMGASVIGGYYGDPTDAGAPTRFTNSTFRNNRTGMYVSGSVDLSGGGNAFPSCGLTRIALEVSGYSVSINVENVAWDFWDADAGGTELWQCDDGSGFCSCSGSSACPSGSSSVPSGDGPIIYDYSSYNPNSVTIDDAKGSQSANACP